MNFLELKNIYKTFGRGENEVKALKDINITIEKGELIAITGKSGCGKSTLLNIIGGLSLPSSGSYMFEGSKISSYNQDELASFRNRNIGFVVQSFALINDMTIFDNIELPLKYAGKKSFEINKRVEELTDKMELSDKTKFFPSQLSGGQCQRASIARALACNPRVLLADEPTGALDEQTGKNILNIFKSLNEGGMTVIIVTHDLEIASICNRRIEMKDGAIFNDYNLN
ncbi:MAG: ABC transporter ATP-binding protein [Acutalibacteraceae bacterium]